MTSKVAAQSAFRNGLVGQAVASWNQIIGWLQEVNLLREVAPRIATLSPARAGKPADFTASSHSLPVLEPTLPNGMGFEGRGAKLVGALVGWTAKGAPPTDLKTARWKRELARGNARSAVGKEVQNEVEKQRRELATIV